MIEIYSYESISGLMFGSSEKEALLRFGSPLVRRKNAWGKVELHYPDFILRYEKSFDAMRECTLLSGIDACLNGHAIEWSSEFLRYLAQQDPELFEMGGFVFSLKLGVSTVGLHQEDDVAIHAFCRGALDSAMKMAKPYFFRL